MFSVNNFYEVFNSHYGWPQKNNQQWVFSAHGSKNWLDITNYGNHAPDLYAGALIMHDQEPFFKDSLNELQCNLLSDQLHVTNSEWYQIRQSIHPPFIAPIDKDYIRTLSPHETLSYYIRSSKVPIFCHSEQNSVDVSYLEQHGYISCYYWWHGMVARDWFRHWQRHAKLSVYNKSTAAHKFVFYCRATNGTRNYRKKIKEYLNNFNVLGSTDSAAPSLSATIDVNDANNSAIHIVAETLFDTSKLYVTEKVFKPIVMSQPFIIFGAPGILQYMKSYGFKSFESLWDESYDLITNPIDRKAAILNLITSLDQLSASEFAEIYNRALPIIQHNRDYFFSSTFQDILWQELTSNMFRALAQQEDLHPQLPGGTDFYHYNNYIAQGRPLSDFAKSYVNNTVIAGTTKKDWVLQRYPAFSNLLS